MVSGRVRTAATAACFSVVAFWSGQGSALAADEKSKQDSGVVDQVGTAVKNTAKKIEQEVKGLVKKIEENETPKKVGKELERSAQSLGEQVGQAGKKLKGSFKSD